ncbi:MAG: ribonuclease Z [Candidatus Atribacteria bacterium]|nr:ribonuclease Z [Candidatus Atribacteria bacterium]MCK4308692.1 ribonuclease Z [Candidatus Atribacteria bacterium]
MKVIFLGTSSGMPTLRRNVSAIALVFTNSNKLWLWDCGEGTQQQIQKTPLKLSKLEKIFITHLHGDHIFGLPGLLASRGLRSGQNLSGIQLYGPEGLDIYLNEVQNITKTYFPYEIEIKVIPENLSKGTLWEDQEYIVRYVLLNHNIKTYGYFIEEKKGISRFLVEKARQFNIPPGPIYGALKEGKTVKLPDGRIFQGKDFISKIRKGRKVVFCGDTTYCENLVLLAKDADLLIHEATFSQQEEDIAKRNFHSTTTIAAQVAKEAQVKQLILTHISPRYGSNNNRSVITERDLLAEAQNIFPQTLLAEDFMEYIV